MHFLELGRGGSVSAGVKCGSRNDEIERQFVSVLGLENAVFRQARYVNWKVHLEKSVVCLAPSGNGGRWANSINMSLRLADERYFDVFELGIRWSND